MSRICSYDEGYDIYDAREIGWCAKCRCDPECPMSKQRLSTDRKRGYWIDRRYEIECSICGFTCDEEYYLGKKIACPNYETLMN